MPISDSKLKSLLGKKHDSKNPKKLADRDGLYAFHYRTGKISFVLRYRYDKKQQELKLGTYPLMSLSKAREEALRHSETLERGLDPKVQKQLEREKILKAVTVKEAIEYWLENYAKKERSNYEKHRSQFAKHVYPYIGHLPLEQCETRHWVKVFDDVTNGTHHRAAPKASGYILQNAKQALKFCRNRQHAHSTALEDLNIADIGEYQGKKDRFLSWGELQAVWKWTNSMESNWYYRNLVSLLILFGCRTQEIRLSRISEWDLDSTNPTWTVPKENSKTGVEICRPIPQKIVSQIKQLIEQSDNEYLLGEVKKPEAVSIYGSSIHKKLGQEKWNLHDLRRSFSTHLNNMQIEPYVVEQLLAHSLGGVMKIYNRSQHLEQKKAALEIWVSKLNNEELKQNNVVGIR
ncbi:conserved hypothetical protein [Vibrio aestuarianus]|uniref:Integrase n=1 Tax=Vibrio aestuarianus TaxID=28171 RepID=A0ABN8TS45_9VIBR|nr:site-specific integrase [Vibrio aestuarianus]MDE1255452.1 site-specific integrase [Vibrio aestuarianus]NLS56809.1 site-specific integrase [Vibrio aestuarianus subsp. francensis]CAH8209793.1 conserved hypothetical protein [Vibrio aestuarianus]CAH8236208.1 conserved hypothetical protein [Vibrio aestuarianus]